MLRPALALPILLPGSHSERSQARGLKKNFLGDRYIRDNGLVASNDLQRAAPRVETEPVFRNGDQPFNIF
jgi:hypothetical protein